jgi:leader peptidase (prepilin peptidase)/N-methyltransferase
MESYPIVIILFCFGLIIGSFLNVVILRSGTGLRISKGRSKCFSCNKTLVWYELIPLVSFVIQKGRCRVCGSKISAQYFFVELATGLALPAAFLVLPVTPFLWINISQFVLVSALLCLYIVITVYDFRHKIIPDAFSYAAALIALITIGLSAWANGSIDFTQVIAGPVLFLFFFFFWAVSKGKWMGLGDAKLALSVGWFLGLSQGVAAILLSFWLGSIITILIMIGQRLVNKAKGRSGHALRMKSEIPFGPFILLGFILVFLFSLDTQLLLSFLAV